MDSNDVKPDYPLTNKRTTNARAGDGAGSVPEFIQKLFRMLENKAFRDTFCWGPDGTTFIVKDTNEFSKTILPKHFKHCNFASFVRQLNKYDFHKVRNADDGHKPYGDQAWEFVHPKFRRDRKDLLEEIRRKTPGKNKKDDASAPAKDKNSTTDGQQQNDDDSNTAESVFEIRKMAETLQQQIAQLQQSQKDMDGTLQRLRQHDTTILGEFVSLSKNMAAKDELIKQFLHIAIERDKNAAASQGGTLMNGSTLSAETQKLLDSYAKLTESNTQQMGIIEKQLQQSQSSWASSVPSSGPERMVPSQPDLGVPPVLGLPQDPSAAAVAAAAMNAGSLVGSPLKTPDGLAFVTVGRITPRQTNDAKTPLSQCENNNNNNMMDPSSSQASQRASASNSNVAGGLSLSRKSNGNGWTVPPRVLLVDDDSVYRDLSGKLLNMIGCTIDLAKDGVEALHKMNAEKYDLILMDIVMPNLDGVSATRNIRQYDMLTPIISMTSNFTDNDIMQYVGSGMTDILPKPFSKRTLYSMLEKYCAHLKVMQRIQEPNGIPRSLGSIELVPEGQISEINQAGPSSSGSSSAASSSGGGAQSSAYIEEITQAQETPAIPAASMPSVPTQQQPVLSTSMPLATQPTTTQNHPVVTSAAAAGGLAYPGMPMDTPQPSQQPMGTPLVGSYHPTATMPPPTTPTAMPPNTMPMGWPGVQQPQQPVIPSNDGKRAWAQACSETPAPQHEFNLAASTLAAKRRKRA
ncbi:hypothetical protein O0I10_008858 [Lichtheimia ornata]|uniref:Transcription factor n=1 Tax=Lichtheimia ornata TaxID=688661 RepID=A0AAD7UYP3_9FUNG|nr:uncharacterized protein O0I10_008858 [Lichtheimia ornata]KAJ8655366.1 hypothetical protein O0I10_008858 [Lichtheimia ornata]